MNRVPGLCHLCHLNRTFLGFAASLLYPIPPATSSQPVPVWVLRAELLQGSGTGGTPGGHTMFFYRQPACF